MKLLRYGLSGQEKPGMLDSSRQLRDLSSVIEDLGGELPFTLEIAAALEREWGTDRRIWLSMENAYQQHPKRRGGKREGAGRKPLGHASKLVRISAPLEQMREINTWLEQQPSAAQRLAQLILEEARKSA